MKENELLAELIKGTITELNNKENGYWIDWDREGFPDSIDMHKYDFSEHPKFISFRGKFYVKYHITNGYDHYVAVDCYEP